MEDKNTITISSTRVYLDGLKKEDLDVVLMTFFRFNRMKEWYYNQSYNERYLGIPFVHENKTETSLLKEKYRELFDGKLMDYYVTSLFSTVNGIRKSQRELLRNWKNGRRTAGRKCLPWKKNLPACCQGKPG